MNLKMELAGCESMLLREIADKRMYQRDIAKTYALAMISSEEPAIDWIKVNRVIIDRWSRSGLERIKNMAWSGKCWEKVRR